MDNKVFDTISSFDQIEELEIKYLKKYGVKPFNISYWDPSEEFSDMMYPHIKIDYNHNPIKYLYTFQIEHIKIKILEKLGFDPTLKDGILTTNGTTSIMMMVHWLKEHGYNRLHVIYPSYFSLKNNCHKENISIIKHDIDYKTGYITTIRPNDYTGEAFWITNPAYSMGHNIASINESLIKELLYNNIVVIDDCVIQNNKTASRLFGNHHNYFGIYVPHKAICMNGVKFSMIVFNCEDEPFFDQSADFLCGGLDNASMAAIEHYVGEEYDKYNKIFQTNIRNTNEWILRTCKEFPECFYTNINSLYINSIYFPNIPYELGTNIDFIWNLMDNTAASIITGAQNEYPKESGFSFRINLARESPVFRATLIRVLYYLSSIRSNI